MDNLRFKFRAWIEEDNEYMFAGSSTGRSVSMSWFWETVYKYGYEVEQYTGLKNLYENDIIQDNIGIGAVEYKSEYAGFRVNYKNGRCKWFYDYLESEMKTIEIIGNIHENPELLEKA